MERCRYDNDTTRPCPFPDNYPYALLRKSCEEDAFGQNCGAILCQALLADTIDRKTLWSTLDHEFGLINANFNLKTTPEGEAPQDVREGITSQIFPLRSKRPLEEGKVNVNHLDLYFTLLNSGKLYEANWYHNYFKASKAMVWWCFEESDGQVNKFLIPPSREKKTIEQYDHSFHLHSPALWNTHVPAFIEVREEHDPSGTFPIKGYMDRRRDMWLREQQG